MATGPENTTSQTGVSTTSRSNSNSDYTGPGALQAHTWLLDPAASTLSPAPETSVTMRFDDQDTASGQGPCNLFHARFEVTDEHSESGATGFRFIDPVGTLMGCEESIMAQETAFFAALDAITDIDLGTPSVMVLSGESVKLVFEAYDATDNISGTYEITSVNTGDALSSPIAGTAPTITFESDRKFSVDGGCNTISGNWSVEADAITLSGITSTEMACTDPDGIMKQEQSILDALRATVKAETTPSRLTLSNAEGNITITATPRQPTR